MGNIAQWWSDSRGKVIATLLFLWLASVLFQFQPSHLISLIVAILGMVISDGILSRHVTLSSIVTGLLIGLVFDPTAGMVPIILACVVASLSKNFIRMGSHNHIFNPAAFGIVSASLLFNRPVSWWGGAWGVLPVIILTVGMAPILLTLRRFWMPVAFLAVYFMSNLLSGSLNGAIRLTLDGTVFLFAFVMIPEIKTSPGKGYWQYWWGILVGVLVYAQSILKVSFADPLLLALLVANFLGFIVVRRNS